jgi:Putative Flp pilus-assembly TadE/G-like
MVEFPYTGDSNARRFPGQFGVNTMALTVKTLRAFKFATLRTLRVCGLNRLVGDAKGASMVSLALLMPVLIGILGLAIDVGMWQIDQRRLQGAADRAAFAAAVAAADSSTTVEATDEGLAILAQLGYQNGVSGLVAEIHNPATGGNYTTDAQSWEVELSHTHRLYFASLFVGQDPTISARAVAVGGSSDPSPFCILTLDPTGAGATTFTNNADMLNAGCNIYTNSSHAAALLCDNNCDIAANTYTVGGTNVSNNGSLSGDVNQTGVSPAVDPYASLPVPDSSTLACTRTALLTVNSNQTISPGVYCGGIKVNANKTLTMQAGTYYIRSKFDLTGNSTLIATSGVTIVLLDDLCIGNGGCRREAGIGNNVRFNLTAPTSGTYAGIALYAQGTSETYQEFSNNVSLNIQGAIYAPGDRFYFHNNANFNPMLCAQIVARRVNFENNATIGTNCDSAGVEEIANGGAGQAARMVE